MAKRKARKRKTRRTRRKKKAISPKNLAANRKAQWKAFKQLEQRAKKAWTKLRSDIRKKASPQVLIRDQNQLLLLLGECNYMAKECVRCSPSRRR